MANGGKRPGAGRPKGFAALAAEQSRIFIAAQIRANEGALIASQIDKAIGQADTGAFNALYNRAFGTPPQSMELTGKDGESLSEPSPKMKELAALLREIRSKK